MSAHLPAPVRTMRVDTDGGKTIWFWVAGCTCGWRAVDENGDPHLVMYELAIEHSMNHVRRKIEEKEGRPSVKAYHDEQVSRMMMQMRADHQIYRPEAMRLLGITS